MNQCSNLRFRKFAFLFVLLIVTSSLLYFIVSKLVRMVNNGMAYFHIYYLCEITMNKMDRKSCAMEITPAILFIFTCILCLFIAYIFVVIFTEAWRIHGSRNVIEAYSTRTPIRKPITDIKDQLTSDDNDDVVFIADCK